MSAAIKEIKKMIRKLSENCTDDDVQYHLFVLEKIKKGLTRAEQGEILSHDTAKQILTKWLSD